MKTILNDFFWGVTNTNLMTEFKSVKNNLKIQHKQTSKYAHNAGRSGDGSDKAYSSFLCF